LNFLSLDFLKNVWQKKPLLIRNALPGFVSPLTQDEMAGLACEEDIESRIILGSGSEFTAEIGPFEESRFQHLPETDWTLLIQAVDHYIPEIAQLLASFRFIPNWRLDDIMASYAVKGGSVGPHFDNYDVFLIQGAGRRNWSVGQLCDSKSPRLNNDQVRLLAEYESQQDWTLEPGDILYLPPCYAHWGISQDDDCITYSVGFRAPSHGDILSHFCDYLLPSLCDELRYSDPELLLQEDSGEISAQALAQVQQILATQVNNSDQIQEWFGRYMTEAKYENHAAEFDPFTTQELREELKQTDTVYRDPASRFAFTNKAQAAILFVNGLSYSCGKSAAQLLSAHSQYSNTDILDLMTLSENEAAIVELFNQGALYVESGSDD